MMCHLFRRLWPQIFFPCERRDRWSGPTQSHGEDLVLRYTALLQQRIGEIRPAGDDIETFSEMLLR